MANTPQALLLRAVLTDLETTGLGRDTSIHQGALHFYKDRKTIEYLLNPNLTQVELGVKQQDLAKQKSHPSDSIRFHPDMTVPEGSPESHKRALAVQLLEAEGKRGLLENNVGQNTVNWLMQPENEKKFLKRMSESMGFTHSALIGAKFPELASEFKTIDMEQAVRARPNLVQKTIQEFETLKAAEIKQGLYTVHNNAKVQDLLAGISAAAKNHTIWIANVEFESKQLGAKVAAIEGEARQMLTIKSLSDEEALKRFTGTGMEEKKVRELIGKARKTPKSELVKELGKSPIRAAISETIPNTTDLFSVTGKEASLARAYAKMTGNWMPVYEAYLKHTNAGDVRDIMDVIKAQLSFSKSMGLIKETKVNALSMDTAYRLYGASISEDLEGMKKFLLAPELHTAGADTRVTQRLVLEQSLFQTHSLYEAQNADLSSKQIIQSLIDNKNPELKSAVKFAKLFEIIGPELEQFHVEKRLHRALTDLITEGTSVQTSGAFTPRMTERMIVEGSEEAPIVKKSLIHTAQAANYNTYETLDDVVEHLRKRAGYNENNVNVALESFMKREGISDLVNNKDLPDLVNNIKNRRKVFQQLGSVESELNKTMSSYFEDVAKTIKSSDMSVFDALDDLKKNMKPLDKVTGNWKAMSLADGKVLKSAGLYGGAIAATVGLIGFGSNLLFGQRTRRHGDETLRTVNFHRWLEANQEYAGLYDPSKDSSGLSPVGIGAELRRMTTDFASPYRGPVYSQYIFEHQDLLREREKYSREIFLKRHFTFEGDIGSFLLSNASNKVQHSINIAGKEVTGHGYSGLMDKAKLIKLDLENYKIDVQDADTIVLQRRGPLNFLAGMFGLNDNQTIVRLAGIDAPETAHAGRKAMAYAEMAKGTLKSMLNEKNIEVLIDPNNITYGRVMGTVFANGHNVSSQMLKRGLVSHLPFRRKGIQQMENNMIYSKYQALAQGGDHNMWGHPMYKAYQDIVKASGKNMTFNSLINPETAVKDSSLMSTIGLMRSAGDMGFYSNEMQTEAALIGQRIREVGFQKDWKTPNLIRGNKQAAHKSYINYLIQDVTSFSAYREKSVKDRVKSSKVSSLNKAMTLDTLGTSNSVYNTKRLFAYSNYGTDQQRRLRMKKTMAASQRQALLDLRRSPTEHWRM